MTVGKGLRKRRVDESGLLEPGMVGIQFGSLKICSRITQGRGAALMVDVICSRCSKTHFARYYNISRRPETLACPHCNPRREVRAPKWIYQRCQAQQQRCENPLNDAYERYGMRGIQFKFSSVADAANWVIEELGIPSSRDCQLDRIDNEGHYAPGNLRWASAALNMNNTRVSGNRQKFLEFRVNYPEVRYADRTLSRMLHMGMTTAQILQHWAAPSCKPKGKYGTYSMQGPYKGSLLTED